MLLVFGIMMLVCGVLGGFACHQKGGAFWVGFLTGFVLTWLGWIVLAVAKPSNPTTKNAG